MTYLLIFTIGPVQRFIASARKTQDLFAGSAILSNLVIEAYHHLLVPAVFSAGGQCELLFPHLDEKSTNEAANPNRFATIVKGNLNANDMARITSGVKKKVIEEKFRDEAWKEICKGLPQELPEHARLQLEYLPEVYWGALPVKDDLSDYAEQYETLESYIGGIKNIRHMVQHEEAGRKCSVDGELNLVIYRRTGTEQDFKKSKEIKGEQYKEPYKLFTHLTNSVIIDFDDDHHERVPIWQISPGEGLSAVSFYKRRFFEEPHRFPSTARIALMHILENPAIKGIKANLDEAWEEYRELDKLIGSHHILFEHSDDQLYYEENITEKTLKDSGIDEDDCEKEMNKIKAAWNKFAARLESEGYDTLSTKYYALLLFDGDKMGSWISGGKLADKNKLQEFQLKLRDLLKDFASKAREILVPPKGKYIYAAGEDFLGFVNLHSLFDVLSQLRGWFHDMVSKPLKNDKNFAFRPDAGDFTFSAGIAIAHYKQPLSTVLEEARKAEKKAKDAGGNRLSISVMRHSGGTTRCVLPFGEISIMDDKYQFKHLEQFRCITDRIRRDEFSNKFIHQMVCEMRVWEDAVEAQMFHVEAARLIARANNTKQKKHIREMTEQVQALTSLAIKNGKVDTRNVFSALRIADFIQRNQKGKKEVEA